MKNMKNMKNVKNVKNVERVPPGLSRVARPKVPERGGGDSAEDSTEALIEDSNRSSFIADRGSTEGL